MNSMRLPPPSHTAHARGFTLVEMLVSTVLIIAIMGLLLSTVDQTQRVWTRTQTKVSQFQSARAAFEAMTRRLSQATLNTYWRAHDPDPAKPQRGFLFRRQSELHFLSGPASRIFTAGTSLPSLAQDPELAYPTHAVFFQAPLGHTEKPDTGTASEARKYRQLDSLLSGCGYFIEYGDDPDRPDFLDTINYPERPRFRLMELIVPAENLTIFRRPPETSVADRSRIEPRPIDENQAPYGGLVDKSSRPRDAFVRPLWLKEALSRTTSAEGGEKSRPRFEFGRVMAENVVALVILPKVAQKDRPKNQQDALDLAPYFEYDSWRILNGDTSIKDPKDTRRTIDNSAREHMLPPIVQVTMVCIDEPSALRVAAGGDGPPPNWTEGLFGGKTSVDTETEFLEQMDLLETALKNDARRLNYRVFTTDVVIRGSKWSKNPDKGQ